MFFIEGFIWGLGTIIFFGPVFFTILNGTLQYGQKAGLIVSVGIIISDLVCALLCSLATPLVTHPTTTFWLTIAGALVLLGMGLKYIISPIQYKEMELQMNSNQYLGFFTKGFIVNISSPFTFVYWLGAEANGANTYHETWKVILYIAGILAGIFLIDVLKVILSKQIRKLLQPKTLKIISACTGIILIGFGISLVVYLFRL